MVEFLTAGYFILIIMLGMYFAHLFLKYVRDYFNNGRP